MEMESDGLKMDIQTVQFQDAPKQASQIKMLTEERNAAMERLTQATKKLADMEQLQLQVAALNKQKDTQVAEIKQLYQDVNSEKQELFKVKEELGQLKNNL